MLFFTYTLGHDGGHSMETSYIPHTLCTYVARFVATDQQLCQLYMKAEVHCCLCLGLQCRSFHEN